jgi:7-alpha-hydroxysteroid dehydrogenase
MGSLENRSIIVTGGGTGIGAACASRLVADGARVTICGRTEATLAEVVDRLKPTAADRGGSIDAHVADVTDEGSVTELVAAALERTGGLHGVVANAGGGGAIAPYHRQDVDEFTRVLQLNVVGTMLMVKHCVTPLARAARDEGTTTAFVGMSSIAGCVTHPYFGAYPVAKAGIDAMMANAADEYGAAGVRFNSVRPGFTSTEIMGLIPEDSEVYASYLENTPLDGVAEPDDVADVVSFLLSGESRWVNGEAVTIDGGHHLRRGPDFSSFAGPLDLDL